ncbi:unnamed protein product [Schistocephalus solidus]|uniref:Ferritin n=1 Tax=Schistocephalus solidus TaxID=70667 RepID=A0A183SY72_SCHSO|nr:unnamed protein product [Schistocephalus solidus]
MESSRVNFSEECAKQFNETASLFLATEQAMITVASRFARLGLESFHKYASHCATKVRAKTALLLEFQAKRGGRFQFSTEIAVPELPGGEETDALRLLEWMHKAKQVMHKQLNSVYKVAQQNEDVVSMEFLHENVLDQLNASIKHVKEHIGGLKNSHSAYLYDRLSLKLKVEETEE